MALPKKTKKAPIKAIAARKIAPKKATSSKTSNSKVSKHVRKVTTKKMVAKPTGKAMAKPLTKPLSKPTLKAATQKERAPKIFGLPEQIRDVALKVLDERQAEGIFTVNLGGKSSIADYLIIASGRASRQLSAIAHYLREAFAKMGLKHIRVEGLSDANWVLVDAGDVVVHLFRPEVRDYYNLENMWNNKKVESEDGGQD